MKRRGFLKKAALTTGAIISAPYILPSGRLFANTGVRVANHVVYVLFAGGIRHQEAVGKQFLANQGNLTTEGNIMNNMISGDAPTSFTELYQPWMPILSEPLSDKGTLFQEVTYSQGPTGHYNGHTVAMTGNYTETGLNLVENPEFPTLFEYYRKHSDPTQSALNAWWISEGLNPYHTLNYSRHPQYGPMYGANYLHPNTVFGNEGFSQLSSVNIYHPDEITKINKIKQLLDNNFENAAGALPGIQNTSDDREIIKNFIDNKLELISNYNLEIATPGNDYSLLNGDLRTISSAWQVLDEFAPELMVVNTTNSDVCHDNFSGYLRNLHRADYGVGWLWDKIQSHPILANDTIMICMPEHGRNGIPNNLLDANGLRAYDHSANNEDANARRCFAMIAGPNDKVVQGQLLGSEGNPAAEAIDIVPTIAHILGFHDDVPGYLLQGRILEEAFL